jgi:4-amino-4-deoxy-L-arabinose transferase-like glycosyltransferase
MKISHHWLNLGLLLALAALLLFLNLGELGLTDRDEGRNAEAGREMLETGDWISPTFNYEPRYQKPALVYWLMTIAYQALGVSEFTARLPSATFGVALILLQYLFLTTCRGAVVGLFGALMLLLNVEIIALSRMALTDSVLIFFITLALFSFWLGFRSEEPDRRWLWLFYVGMALATLTKGPVGFLVPLVTVALYLAMTGQWGRFWREGYPLAGTAILALLALPWYVLMWSRHGAAYAASAQANTVGRFFNPMEGHGFTIFFYLPVLMLGFFPWSGWLPFAWYQAFKTWQEARKAEVTRDVSPPQPSPNLGEGKGGGVTRHLSRSNDELDWFAAAWVLAVLVFFTLSSTRLPHYIGPLFPAAAILTSSYWHRSLVHPTTRGARAAIHTVMLLGCLLALAFAFAPTLYSKFSDKLVEEFPAASQIDLGNGPYFIATTILMGMAIVGYLGLHDERRPGAFWTAGATLALVVLILLVVTLPRMNRFTVAPQQELAYAAGLNLGADDRLIAYGTTRPSTVFYAKRKVIFVGRGEEERMREHLRQPGRTMILLPARLRPRLPLETVDYPIVLQRFGYILLANRSMVNVPAPPEAPPAPRIPGH